MNGKWIRDFISKYEKIDKLKINIILYNMSKTLRIRIPNYKSKVNVIKLNKLIRLNKVKNKKSIRFTYIF